jgi:hypothetical protein
MIRVFGLVVLSENEYDDLLVDSIKLKEAAIFHGQKIENGVPKDFFWAIDPKYCTLINPFYHEEVSHE